jgi:hypothetical protein
MSVALSVRLHVNEKSRSHSCGNRNLSQQINLI